jgi:hypothetical protein
LKTRFWTLLQGQEILKRSNLTQLIILTNPLTIYLHKISVIMLFSYKKSHNKSILIYSRLINNPRFMEQKIPNLDLENGNHLLSSWLQIRLRMQIIQQWRKVLERVFCLAVLWMQRIGLEAINFWTRSVIMEKPWMACHGSRHILICLFLTFKSRLSWTRSKTLK